MYPLVGRLDRNRRTLGLVRISTLAPLAGCDAGFFAFAGGGENFNPRTPCGVRLRSLSSSAISTSFQSTHPLRGATAVRLHRFLDLDISIHAPLAGCDACGRSSQRRRKYFNPRTPCGVRQGFMYRGVDAVIFQSTHPLRGATVSPLVGMAMEDISIHAPLAGCDAAHQHHRGDRRISIHAPLAGCDRKNLVQHAPANISIHAPLAGCDAHHNAEAPNKSISIHAPLAGCDKSCERSQKRILRFQSTHPLRGATRQPTTFCPRM